MLNIYLMILSPGTYQGHNQLTLTLASLPNRREKKVMDSLKGDIVLHQLPHPFWRVISKLRDTC